MLTFTEFINEQVEWQVLNEFSLARIFQHTQTSSVAFISASRAGLPPSENSSREAQLKQAIRNAGYGYVRINGHYIEKHDDGAEIPVVEHSFMVIGDDDGQLRSFAIKMGEQFDQDSILFKPKGADAMLIGTTTRASWLGHGATQNIGSFHPSRMGDFYSQYKGKSFVFDNIAEQTNLMGRAAHRKSLMKEHGKV